MTGLPPLQFQLECRLQQAAALLLSGDVTVAGAARPQESRFFSTTGSSSADNFRKTMLKFPGNMVYYEKYQQTDQQKPET